MSVICDGGFLRVFLFPPSIKLMPRFNWNIVENHIKHHKSSINQNKIYNLFLDTTTIIESSRIEDLWIALQTHGSLIYHLVSCPCHAICLVITSPSNILLVWASLSDLFFFELIVLRAFSDMLMDFLSQSVSTINSTEMGKKVPNSKISIQKVSYFFLI